MAHTDMSLGHKARVELLNLKHVSMWCLFKAIHGEIIDCFVKCGISNTIGSVTTDLIM